MRAHAEERHEGQRGERERDHGALCKLLGARELVFREYHALRGAFELASTQRAAIEHAREIDTAGGAVSHSLLLLSLVCAFFIVCSLVCVLRRCGGKAVRSELG